MAIFNKRLLEFFSISFFILFGLLAYEYNIYKYNGYFLLSLLSFLSIFIFLYFINKGKVMYRKNDVIFFLLAVYCFYHLLVSFYHTDGFSVLRYSLFPIVILSAIGANKYRYDIFHLYILFLIPVAVIAFSIEFLGFNYWNKIFNRNAAVFFDPNYSGMIFGLAAVLTLLFKGFFYRFLFIVFLMVMALSYSKGAYLAFIVSMSVYVGMKYGIFKAILSFSFLFLFFGLFFQLFFDLNMLRFDQGFNSRDDLWSFVFKTVYENEVFLGLGAEGFNRELISNGFTNSSTHNFYIDSLAIYGFFSFFINIVLFVFTLIKGLLLRSSLTPVFVFIFIASNTVTFSFGGVGLISYINTLIIISILFFRDNTLYENTK